MGRRQKPKGTRGNAVEQAMRDQEVLRANKELAAYFKGQRTEREARAALKIIKAFVRDRERRDVSDRTPLPSGQVAKIPKGAVIRTDASARRKQHRPKLPRAKPVGKPVESVRALNEPAETPERPDAPESVD